MAAALKMDTRFPRHERREGISEVGNRPMTLSDEEFKEAVSHYSLDDLIDVKENIDRLKLPGRYELVLAEIARRKKEGDISCDEDAVAAAGDGLSEEPVEAIKKGRATVIGIACAILPITTLLTSLIGISETRDELSIHIIRFTVIAILCWYLYKGYSLARWFLIITLGLLGIVLLLFALFGTDETFHQVYAVGIGLLYLVISAILLKSPNVRMFLKSQQEKISGSYWYLEFLGFLIFFIMGIYAFAVVPISQSHEWNIEGDSISSDWPLKLVYEKTKIKNEDEDDEYISLITEIANVSNRTVNDFEGCLWVKDDWSYYIYKCPMRMGFDEFPPGGKAVKEFTLKNDEVIYRIKKATNEETLKIEWQTERIVFKDGTVLEASGDK